ncbi:hypothetical protein [Sphingomonas dokdonensis]|uniref:hypothetical protein n=1 Tax=Sphingomonas dokdonensis TaxID=344880 RepID=UPI000B4A8E4C|nr:hypothetical protein [Sphingomonas dokdonensis]
MIARSQFANAQPYAGRSIVAAPPILEAMRQRVRIIVEDCRDLMALTQATLIQVSRYRAERPRLSLWNAQYAADRGLLASYGADPATAAWTRDIEEISAALIDHLASKWSPTCTPPRIGFITDGTGLGMSTDDPCPSRPGWLLRQLSGECALTCLLPFAGGTPWPLIHPINRASPAH